MFKYIILSGILAGLTMQPVLPETYTGGISADSDQPVTIAVRLQPSEPQVTKVNLHPKLSAVGFHWEGPQHVITYVDPASSVYGTIFPGDREISLAGMDPKQSEIQRKNYGANNTTVEIVFQKPDGRRLRLSVLRQPVANFSPELRRTMLPY